MIIAIIVSTTGDHPLLGPKLVLDQSTSLNSCLQSLVAYTDDRRESSCDLRPLGRGDDTGEGILVEIGAGSRAVMTQ